MRRAEVFVHGIRVGMIEEFRFDTDYRFTYDADYEGPPVSLTMPVKEKSIQFRGFPAFFEGLLPEGVNLEALLQTRKIDRNDLFGQLCAVGADTVGAVTVREIV